MADALHQWMRQQRQKIPDGSATAKAIDYSLNRWAPLTRYIDDGDLPIDNNWVENQIRPIALGRNNSHDRLSSEGTIIFRVAASAATVQARPQAGARTPSNVSRRSLKLSFGGWVPHGDDSSEGCLNLAAGSGYDRPQIVARGFPLPSSTPWPLPHDQGYVDPTLAAGCACWPIAQMKPSNSRATAVTAT